MPSNLERFEKDLEKLIVLGDQLDLSMRYECYKNEITESIETQIGKEKAAEFIKAIPDFSTSYESWYSEAIVLIKQIMPDRLINFISFYEKPKTRKEIQYGNYVIQDYLQNLRVTSGLGETKVDKTAAIPQFRQQLSIIKAAKQRFKSSLFEIRQLVQADLFDSEVEAARELLKNKFFRASGAIAGVVLEKHLQQVCSDHDISVKKNPGISVLSEALKSNSIIDVPQWRHISMLGDIRNICDHSKGQDPTQQQIQDLIDGTDKILKTVY